MADYCNLTLYDTKMIFIIMKQKYNLALIPQAKAEEVIHLSQKLSKLADKYLLGKNSNPHVTLYQFEMEAQELAPLCSRLKKEWQEKPIALSFGQLSYTTFNKRIYWISLLPKQTVILHKLHSKIAELIGLPVKTAFDPHMTLINSKNKPSEQEVQKLLPLAQPLTDTFILCLGSSDEVGQLTEILYRFEPF